MLCQRRNDLDFRKLMDNGGIVIANLSKGTIGEDASALLGSVLLSKLILAGLSRAEVPETKRTFFAIYADEAQQFLTESSVSLFAELRKFGVAGVWSAQYLTSLPDKLREGILGNVGSQVVFALSGEDAEIMAQEFAPVARQEAFVGLPAYNFYAKLKIDGITSRAFSGETVPLYLPEWESASKQSLPHFNKQISSRYITEEAPRESAQKPLL